MSLSRRLLPLTASLLLGAAPAAALEAQSPAALDGATQRLGSAGALSLSAPALPAPVAATENASLALGVSERLSLIGSAFREPADGHAPAAEGELGWSLGVMRSDALAAGDSFGLRAIGGGESAMSTRASLQAGDAGTGLPDMELFYSLTLGEGSWLGTSAVLRQAEDAAAEAPQDEGLLLLRARGRF